MLQKVSFAGNFVLMAALVVAASTHMFQGLELWHLEVILLIGLGVTLINVFAGVQVYDWTLTRTKK